ncbi:MAG: hypothetical protein EOM54_10460 [Clostridia bacterium]|nr:hypothetical protein [Clostridia bacterium]
MASETVLEFGIIDTAAAADATPSTNGAQAFSDLGSVLDIENEAVDNTITGEWHAWGLDGTMEKYDSADEYGYWSTYLSGADGTYSTPPVLTASFSANHTSLGVTLGFAGDCWCSEVNVKWYDGADALLYSVDFEPDSFKYFCEQTVENYRKVVVTFNKTNLPYRYVKLESIIFGAIKVLGSGDIISAKLHEAADISATEVPYGYLDAEIYSSDSNFDILNPQGVYAALQSRQPITVRQLVGGALTRVAKVYLTDWESDSEDTMAITAVDALGIADSMPWEKTLYSTTTSASTVIEAIGSASGVSVSVASAFSASSVLGLLNDGTCLEAFQQVALAIGAYLHDNRDGVAHFDEISTASIAALTSSHIFRDPAPKLTLKTLVTGVEVTPHSFDLSGSDTPGTPVGVYLPDLPAGSAENVISIADATLAHSGNALAIAQRLYALWQRRYQYEFSGILGGAERCGLGLTASAQNGYVVGNIKILDIDLTGGYLGNFVIVGEAVTSS